MNKLEYLVTGMAYEKNDPYKQTLLLHDTFLANDADEAKDMFHSSLGNSHEILKIYSSVVIMD